MNRRRFLALTAGAALSPKELIKPAEVPTLPSIPELRAELQAIMKGMLTTEPRWVFYYEPLDYPPPTTRKYLTYED